MNFGTVSGIDLRLCAVLSVSLALGTGPALAQVKADEPSSTVSDAVNLSTYFAADASHSGAAEPALQPPVVRTEPTQIAQRHDIYRWPNQPR